MDSAEHETLPRDAPILFAIEDHEILLRRFNPHNPHHLAALVVDEGQVAQYQLKISAFDGFSADGCSVSRDAVLAEANVAREEVLQPPKYICLAEGSVEGVQAVQFTDATGASVAPFQVAPDAYPPRDAPERSDVAHALIKMRVPTKADRAIALGILARQVFRPLLEDVVPPVSGSLSV